MPSFDWIVIPSFTLLAAAVILATRQAQRRARLVQVYQGLTAGGRPSEDLDARAYYRLRFEQVKAFLGLPPSFGFLVEADGPYPKGHSQAVSWLAIQIAREMGLSKSEIEEIRLGGLLHDIGKTHVPWHVLNKPALLTAEEFELMKSHAAWGEKMLRPLALKNVARIVRHHHERYDGKGYPDGLVEQRIPLGARIVAVAESFDDMVSDLPYKTARSLDDAIAEIRRFSGSQFDPEVVEAFLESLRNCSDPRLRSPQEEEISVQQAPG